MGSIRSRSLGSLLFGFLVFGIVGEARANQAEDQFGVSARINAMGGAGTALATDPSALYYNPGGLGFCTESQVMLDVRQNVYNLHVDAINASAPKQDPNLPQQPPDETRATVAGCLRLPRHFAVGILFSTGLETPARFSAQTPNDQPRWAAYGDQKWLTINAAMAYRPIPELSIGAGGAISINSILPMTINVPVAQVDANGQGQPTAFDIRWTLAPSIAPYIGVMASPTPDLKFGVTYRGYMQHHLAGPLDITTTLTINTNPTTVHLPMQLVIDSWFSPRQIAAGGAWTLFHRLTLAADVTWYQYSQIRKSGSPYPYIGLTGAEYALTYTQVDPPLHWQDVVAIRLGGELRMMDGKLGLRGGYSYRSPMLPSPGKSTVTLLDRPVHALSVGVGYTFGAPPQARAPQASAPQTPRYRRATRPGYDLDGWTQPTKVHIRARIDAFARAMILPSHADAARGYDFGGQIYDGGVTLTLGWY